MIISYSFCVLADDAISNLTEILIKNKERRHAAYCFKPGPSLYPESIMIISDESHD